MTLSRLSRSWKTYLKCVNMFALRAACKAVKVSIELNVPIDVKGNIGCTHLIILSYILHYKMLYGKSINVRITF